MQFNSQSVRIWVVSPKGFVKIRVPRGAGTTYKQFGKLYCYFYDGVYVYRIVIFNPGPGERISQKHHCPVRLLWSRKSMTDDDVAYPSWIKG